MDGLHEQTGMRGAWLNLLPWFLRDNPLPAIWNLSLRQRRKSRPLFRLHSATVLFFQILSLLSLPLYLIEIWAEDLFVDEFILAALALSFIWLLFELASSLSFAGSLLRSRTQSTYPVIDEALAASSLSDRDFLLALLWVSLPRLVLPCLLLSAAYTTLFRTDYFFYGHDPHGHWISQWLLISALSVVTMTGLILLQFGLGQAHAWQFAPATGTAAVICMLVLATAGWFITVDNEWMMDQSYYVWQIGNDDPRWRAYHDLLCRTQLGLLIMQFLLIWQLLRLAVSSGLLRRILLACWPVLCGLPLWLYGAALVLLDPNTYSALLVLRLLARAGMPLSVQNLDVLYVTQLIRLESIARIEPVQIMCLSILLQFAYLATFLHFARRMLAIHRRGAA
ncbi:hypothetical protein KDL44_05355 [bacterium]|nr:hypothetical protein [bacterium]